jgi:acyl-coenzyme A thioesterase PaaI-like protein
MSLVDMMNGAMATTIPAAHNMGIKAVAARRGHAAATVPLAGNGNHFGVVYAGVEFTVAEILGGIIAIASFDAAKYYPLVKKVDIEFTGMARSDLAPKRRSTKTNCNASKPKPRKRVRPTSRWTLWSATKPAKP